MAKKSPTKSAARSPAKLAVKRAAANDDGASSESTGVKVFQIHFKGEQANHLDDAFTHYDNAGVESETHEFAVFQKLHQSPLTRGLRHWGAVSWRFHEKTGLEGQALLTLVAANPEVDVFYMNPYPYNEAIFQSGWMQGETTHPEFLRLAQKFLVAAGFDANEVLRIDNSASFSAANYFVGTPAFWDAYIPFIEKALQAADKNLAAEDAQRIHSPEADVKSLHHGSTYIPFIVERMFALFMRTEGAHLKARKVTLPAQENKTMNEHLRSLRALKDAAVKSRSAGLYAIWANYRNLYCQMGFKPFWAKKYLPTLNPKEVVW
jgi:hypothetical protein